MLHRLDPTGIAPDDLERVHALNAAAVPAVGAASVDHLAGLVRQGRLTLVARGNEGLIQGFAIVLGPGCDYESPNYQFFARRHDDFAYVDRIAIDTAVRGQGLGRMLYEAILTDVPAPVLCAEVNVRPRNEASLAFHERMGFQAVGEQEAYGGTTRVRLLERPLEG